MFSSLASFLFGSNTNCETTATAAATTDAGKREERDTSVDKLTEEVPTSLPPRTGAIVKFAVKRGRKRNSYPRRQKTREGNKASLKAKPAKGEYCEEENFLGDDWFVVENENLQRDVAPVPEVENEAENVPDNYQSVQHINFNLLKSAIQQDNEQDSLPETSNHNRTSIGLSVSQLSPSPTEQDGRGSGHECPDDEAITRSLCLPPTRVSVENDEQATNDVKPIKKMEESWFVTPPPCFTSTGPINMETSPYENLLIEHPSMSVYHSIKSAQKEPIESYVELEIKVMEKLEKKEKIKKTYTPKQNNQATLSRIICPTYNLNYQWREELMKHNVKKVHNYNERNAIGGAALIKRANKVRDVLSKNQTKRRADYQHSKILSYANNNRKCNCY